MINTGGLYLGNMCCCISYLLVRLWMINLVISTLPLPEPLYHRVRSAQVSTHKTPQLPPSPPS